MDLTHDGVTQALQEWAVDYGIPCALIRDRLRRGWSVERAITRPMNVRNNDRLERRDLRDRPSVTTNRYTYGDVSLTVAEWSERSGISKGKIYARLSRGWTMEHVLNGRPRPVGTARLVPRQRREPKLVTFNGMALTMEQWAGKLGITRAALLGRINSGWPPERTFGTERPRDQQGRLVHGRAPRLIEFDGEALSAKDWAARLGIDVCTLNGRLNNPDWTVERALTTGNTGTRRRACRPRPRPRPLGGDQSAVTHP